MNNHDLRNIKNISDCLLLYYNVNNNSIFSHNHVYTNYANYRYFRNYKISPNNNLCTNQYDFGDIETMCNCVIYNYKVKDLRIFFHNRFYMHNPNSRNFGSYTTSPKSSLCTNPHDIEVIRPILLLRIQFS